MKEPLAGTFKDFNLNSAQIDRLRRALKAEYERGAIEELEKLDELKEVDNTYSTNTKILYSVPFERIVTRTNKLKAIRRISYDYR